MRGPLDPLTDSEGSKIWKVFLSAMSLIFERRIIELGEDAKGSMIRESSEPCPIITTWFILELLEEGVSRYISWAASRLALRWRCA